MRCFLTASILLLFTHNLAAQDSPQVPFPSNFRNAAYSLDTKIDWLKNEWAANPDVHISKSLYYGDRSGVMTILSRNTQYGSQRILNVDRGFCTDSVQEYWNQGYRITDLGVSAQQNYRIIMTQNTGMARQAFMLSAEFPSKYIKERWDKNYYITSLTYSLQGEWSLVMSIVNDYNGQVYFSDADFPKKEYDKYYKEGYRITSLEGDGLSWHVVMTGNTNFKEQKYLVASEWPTDWIRSMWKENYQITGVASKTRGGFVVVMSSL